MAKSLKKIVADSPWRALLLAIVLLVGGQGFLLWQYQRLEGQRIERLEQKVQEQQEMMEERAAQEALQTFLEARRAGDESRIVRYVSEQAQLQLTQEVFEFAGVQDWRIEDKERFAEEAFRFEVEIVRERIRQVELIEVRKIGENYYVDSVQLAG